MAHEQTEREQEPQPLPRQPSLFAPDALTDDSVPLPHGEDTVVPPALDRSYRTRSVGTITADALSLPASTPLSVGQHEVAAPGRLYLTADLRAATGLPRTATDFYLRAGVLRPTARAESGYLLFDERELTILRRVLEWRERGIGLREIKARLGR